MGGGTCGDAAVCPVSARKPRPPTPRRLFISFSGGRTSAYMLWRILNSDHGYDEVVTLFANTGQEHPETLVFVDQVDRAFGANVVWLEAVIRPESKKGTRHKVVDLVTAHRGGGLFADFARKYGLPSQSAPGCTRDLKLNPMKSYLRSIGWRARSYDTAIGIRADEMDRIAKDAVRERKVYPLIRDGITKGDVRRWWSAQPFDLTISEPFGNCVWCWKKSDRKLATLAREYPEAFAVPRALDAAFSESGPLAAKEGPQRMFRGRRTTDEVMAMAGDASIKSWTGAWEDCLDLWDAVLDVGGACGDACGNDDAVGAA